MAGSQARSLISLAAPVGIAMLSTRTRLNLIAPGLILPSLICVPVVISIVV
jgi:hypothetical protein